MRAWETALLVAFASILTLCFALAIACGDDDDDDDDDSDSSDVCEDFCEIIVYCGMDEEHEIYTMDECLDFCLQVGATGNCVMEAADCDEARACFEEEPICDEGEIWDEQLGECIPEECGLDRYPDAPFDDKALLFVDASYTGDSDGSAEKPFKTIAETLAHAGEDTSILIAAGNYIEFDTLRIELNGLDIIGRCSYLSKARSAEGRTVLRIDDSSTNLIKGIAFFAEGESDWALPIIKLSGTSNTEFISNSITDSMGTGLSVYSCDSLSISGNHINDNPGRGIYAQDSEQISITDNVIEGNSDAGIFFSFTSGTISGNHIHDNPGRGIYVQDSEQVSVEDNIIESNSDGGIIFFLASGVISGNQISGTKPNEQGDYGYGIEVERCEEVSILDNTIENNTDAGILFADSNGTISGNEVLDTRSNEQGQYGRGIEVYDTEDVAVIDNTVEGNTECGVFFHHVSGTISGNDIRDTKPSGQGNDGRGINVQESDDVFVTDNTVEGNTSEGIYIATASGTISGNYVCNSLADEEGGFGDGIRVQDSEQISVSTNIVEGSVGGGIVFISTNGAISGNEVRNTKPGHPNNNGYTFGHGIHVQNGNDIECSTNTVENNIHAGIFYIMSSGNILDNLVSGTRVGSRDSYDYGDGIAIVDAYGFISIQENTVDSNDRSGILADSSTGMIERNGIFGNENSIVAQNDSDMAVSDNDIHDNDVNDVQYFEGRELPVNDSMIERNGML